MTELPTIDYTVFPYEGLNSCSVYPANDTCRRVVACFEMNFPDFIGIPPGLSDLSPTTASAAENPF